MEFCRQPFLVLETISNLSKENRFRYIAPFVIFKLQTTQYVAHSLLNLVQIYPPFQTTLHSVDFYKIYMERSFGSRRFCFKFRFGYILFNIYIGSVGYHIVHPHHIWPSLLPQSVLYAKYHLLTFPRTPTDRSPNLPCTINRNDQLECQFYR